MAPPNPPVHRTELKITPVPHEHDAYLSRARTRKGFFQAYVELEPEYEVITQLLKVRNRTGLTQDAVAQTANGAAND